MDSIQIRGARQHSLRGVDVDLRLGELVVICGRSGSGKSSFAFDTVHAEAQRRYVDALSARHRKSLVQLPRPDVDLLRGLVPTIALQQSEPASWGQTIADRSELWEALRVLFGRAATLVDPVSGERVEPVTLDQITQSLMGLEEGTRLTIEVPVRVEHGGTGVLEEIVRNGFSRVRLHDQVMRVEEVPQGASLDGLRVVVDRIKVRPDRRSRIEDAVRTASRAGHGQLVAVTDAGEQVFVDRPWSASTQTLLPELTPSLFSRRGVHACEACQGAGRLDDGTHCEACEGTGLGPVAAHAIWGTWTLPRLLCLPLEQWREASASFPKDPVSAPLVGELLRRVEVLCQLKLGGRRPGERLAMLSAGERQCLRIARQLSSELTGILYVLDEPAQSLDAERVACVVEVMRQLVARGNGVLAVEHHPAVIDAADRVLEFGPGPGTDGGRLLFDGTPEALKQADTPTGRALRRDQEAFPPVQEAEGCIVLAGAPGVRVPHGRLTVIHGATASGKTRVLGRLASAVQRKLANETVEDLSGADAIVRLVQTDDLSVGRSSRSIPATYTGLWSTMRELLAATREAQVRGLTATSFSLNVKGGRCEHCRGLGVRRVELGILPDVHVVCEVCGGHRFSRDVLEVMWKGLNASELLALTVQDAGPLLSGHPALDAPLRALADVGLGYVPLGQPTWTLSGGEARRLRLARELTRLARHGGAGALYVVDEPERGLHPVDVDLLIDLFRRLVEEGATVVLATHEPSVVARADHRIAL